jgi:hypothetical protein
LPVGPRRGGAGRHLGHEPGRLGQGAVGGGEQAGLEHEVVAQAGPPGVGDVHPGGRGGDGQPPGVGGEQVVGPALDQQRRQARGPGQQRRDRGVGPAGGARVGRGAGLQPGRAEHGVAADQLGRSPAVRGQVQPRCQQHGAGRERLAGLAAGQQQGQGQAAARRVAGQHDDVRTGVAERGLHDLAGVFERGRAGVLGGQPVVGQHHPAPREAAQARGPGAHDARGADAVAPAVEVEDGDAGAGLAGGHHLGGHPVEQDRLDRGPAGQG